MYTYILASCSLWCIP